jgi:uncharacterized membrane protein YdjX (TVP38/TMEM64 family)
LTTGAAAAILALPMTAERTHRRTAAVIIIGVVAVGLVALFALAGTRLWYYFRNREALRCLIQSWGASAPLGIIALQALQILIAPLPGSIMSFVGGYALGAWPAVVWLMLGVLVGATLDFLIARFLGRRVLRLLVPPDKLARLDSAIIHRGAFYIFLLLLIPNPIGDWIYYLAGLTPLPLPVFLAFVFIARLPSNLIEAILGSSATRFTWVGWVVLGAVVLGLSVAYYLNQRRIEALIDRLSSRRSGRDSGTSGTT